MFEGMLEGLRETVTQTLALVEVGAIDGQIGLIMPGVGLDPAEFEETRTDPALMGTGMAGTGRDNVENFEPKQQPVRNEMNPDDPATWNKTPRNAPCPCGSGKKFKHCHGALNKAVAP